MTNVFAAKYTMQAEVYDEQKIQESSGAIKRTWDYASPVLTIRCDARIISPIGTRVNFVETWGPQYSDSQFVSITTDAKLDNRQRIGKLMAKNDWLASEFAVFDILAVYPVVDPFGQVIEFNVLAATVTKP